MANPFTAVGATTGAALIKNIYAPGIVDTIYRNGWFSMLPSHVQAGDTHYRYVLRRAANDSLEVFTEGMGQSAPSASEYQNVAIAWTMVRGQIQITGHAMDALQSHRAGGPIDDQEIQILAEDLADLLSTQFLGSSVGITAAICDTTAWGGITRGAASYFESAVSAVSGPLTTDACLDLLEEVKDNDRGFRSGFWLMPWNQATNLYRLGGSHVIANSNVADKAPGYLEQTLCGLPVVAVGDLDDNTILLVDSAQGNIGTAVIRPLHVRQMGPSGDSDIYSVSTGAAFFLHDPRRCGKLTGVTA